MPILTQQEADAAIQAVVSRATADPAFRQFALSNPPEAVREATGKDLPPGYRLRLVDGQGANMTIVLPDPQGAEGELSETELEQVAGGKSACAASCGISCISTCVCISLPTVTGA